MAENTTFRIIVATHSRPRDLAVLLKALVPQVASHPNFKLVVVNDGTHSEQYDAVIEPHRAYLEYRILETSGGAATARQAGLADAEEDYLITTDDDCIPPPDWIGKTQRLALAYPHVDFFVGETTAVRSAQGGFAEEFITKCGHMPHTTSVKGWLVIGICAIMMFRREAFERAGGFTKEIAGSGQDWNLTHKILRSGARYLAVPDWTTGHTAETTFGKTVNRFYRYGHGAAQHVLHEKDWEGAKLFGVRPRSIREALARALRMASKAYKDAGKAVGLRNSVWMHGLTGGLVGLSLGLGWFTGLRRFERQYCRSVPADLEVLANLESSLAARRGIRKRAVQDADSVRFCIVVATYRRPDDLARYLDSVVPQVRDRSNVRIVVVNDGSHSVTYDRVIEPYRGAIEYRSHPANIGHGPIRRVACEDATEDYLVFTDDDCIAPPGWFDWLEAMVGTYPEVDLFAGRTAPVNSERPGIVERYLCYAGRFPIAIVSDGKLKVAVTANMAVRREVFEKAGGFDPDFNTASEDWNLTYRLNRLGVTYRVSHDWVIGHAAEQSFLTTWRRFYNYGFGGAHHVLYAQDWRAGYERMADQTAGNWIQTFDSLLRQARDNTEIQKLPAIERWICYALSIIVGLQYRRGWRAGDRYFSKKYGVAFPADYVPRARLEEAVSNPARPYLEESASPALSSGQTSD